MKAILPVVFISVMGCGSVVMADCGTERPEIGGKESAVQASENVGTSQTRASQAEAQKDSVSFRWSTEPAKRDPIYAPYEDGGYNP
jgi:hypothetical protein